MLDLFKDYGTNVALYPQFQRFFRERRPPTLIVSARSAGVYAIEALILESALSAGG